MSVRPDSADDGPVKVYLDDDNILTFDRIRYMDSMIQLYDVDQDGNRTRKGDRAMSIPIHRVEEVQYLNYGSE